MKPHGPQVGFVSLHCGSQGAVLRASWEVSHYLWRSTLTTFCSVKRLHTAQRTILFVDFYFASLPPWPNLLTFVALWRLPFRLWRVIAW